MVHDQLGAGLTLRVQRALAPARAIARPRRIARATAGPSPPSARPVTTRILGPAVRLGDRAPPPRLSRARPRRRPVQRRGDAEVAEAADLQPRPPARRASSSACSRWRAGVVEPRGPQLRDPRFMQRDRPKLVAERRGRPAGCAASAASTARIASSAACEVAAPAREREREHGQQQVEARAGARRRTASASRSATATYAALSSSAPSSSAQRRRRAPAPRRWRRRRRGNAASSSRTSPVRPSRVRSRWLSASRRAASGQSRAACAWRIASTTSPVLLVPLGRRPVQRADQSRATSAAARAAAGRRTGGGSETTSARRRARSRTRWRPRAPAGSAPSPSRPVRWSASGPLTRSSTEVRSSSSRTSARLALQHLGQQVAGHGPLAAGELGHEALRVGMPGERDRRQPQPGRPALRALVEPRRRRRRTARPRLPASSACVSASEKRRSAPRISVSSPGQPQAMQAEARVLARGQHDAQPWRAAGPGTRSSQRSASAERSSCRSSITSTAGSSSDARSDSSCSTTRLAAEARRRRRPARPPPPTAAASASITRQPEPLRVLLAALDRHPRDAVRAARPPRPTSAAAPSCRCRRARRRAPPRRRPRRTAARTGRPAAPTRGARPKVPERAGCRSDLLGHAGMSRPGRSRRPAKRPTSRAVRGNPGTRTRGHEAAARPTSARSARRAATSAGARGCRGDQT